MANGVGATLRGAGVAGRPAAQAGPGSTTAPQAAASLASMWRTVFAKAAQVADQHIQAALLDHRYRLHGRESLNVVLDQGGSALTAGTVCDVELPWAYQLEAWALYADLVGSLVVDLQAALDPVSWPTVASICGTTPPTLAAARAARSTDLSGWLQTALPQGTVLRVQVQSAATITRATLSLFLRPI
jgi:hypothetical protein